MKVKVRRGASLDAGASGTRIDMQVIAASIFPSIALNKDAFPNRRRTLSAEPNQSPADTRQASALKGFRV
ncbi:MAG: hypothetical protein ABWY18_15005 [Tardiphaga sp.]